MQKTKGKPKGGNHKENYIYLFSDLLIYLYSYLFWKILLENGLAKKKKSAFLSETESFGGKVGLDITCEANFLDRTSLLLL